MGRRLFDEYSLLHLAVGVVAQFWQIPFWIWMVLHTLFELSENTPQGMHFINTWITVWPGGKPSADSWTNIFGDTVAAAVGWLIASRSRILWPE
jgi:hypothetical protein